MKQTILVLDINEVLDQSQFGQRAARHLRMTWERTQQKLSQPNEQAQARKRIEKERAELRQQVLEGVQQCLPTLVQKYDASYIIDRSSALLFPQEADITKEVIAMLDQSTTSKQNAPRP